MRAVLNTEYVVSTVVNCSHSHLQ